MHGACTATNTKYIPNEYCIHCTDCLFFPSSYSSHRIASPFFHFIVSRTVCGCLPSRFLHSALSPLGLSSCASLIGLAYMWILFISSTHKIHSLFIPSPVPFCMCDCALLFNRYVLFFWRFFGAFFLLATLLNGVATTDQTGEKKNKHTHTITPHTSKSTTDAAFLPSVFLSLLA